ncbi:MAG: DUF2497 domain-containing protein [Alphaproteobacteria bacterium]|nr:DUF2497 domain-containing protein [Alphaproteobacteria bacterium]
MASNPQHEPTMEEILASIRKIISEDSNENAAPAAAPAPAPAPTPAPAAAAPEEPEVLELTQELPEEAPPPPAPKPEPVRPAPPPVEDLTFETREEPAPAAAVSSDEIFSDKTRKALDETFAKIPEAVAPTPAPAPVQAPRAAAPAPDGSSVEAVFERAVANAFDPLLQHWMDSNKQDLLNAVKPLIREWMDEHFPALLEGAVRNEVERVVRSRGGK